MTSRFIIYGLTDPRTGQIRYVGLSTQGMRRTRQHAFPSHVRRPTRVACWIRSLLSKGLLFGVTVLEKMESKEGLPAAECRWIARGRELGWDLLNLTDGGEGTVGFKHSTEFKERTSRFFSEIERTPEWRARIGASLVGRPVSAESRQRIADKLRGRSLSPECRERISVALRGRKVLHRRPCSAETRRKMSQAHLGRRSVQTVEAAAT